MSPQHGPGRSARTPAEVEIENALVRLARRTADPRSTRLLNERAGVDFDRSSWILLARIGENEPVRLSDLAELIGIDVSTASRQVSKLVDSAVVARTPDPADARALLHELTARGRVVLDRMYTARRERIERILVPFDATERRELAGLLVRLVDSIDANTDRTGGELGTDVR